MTGFMTKVYPKFYIDKIIEKYDVTLISITTKTAKKEIREKLKNIKNVNYLFSLLEDKNEFVKKMFPVTFERLTTEYGCFESNVYYREEDNKLILKVNDRTFKKTINYFEEEVEDFTKSILKNFHKLNEKCFGYFLTDDGYVTDCNKINGVYKKIENLVFLQ
jgi:hypothetical protein